jgi:superoxide oxidase
VHIQACVALLVLVTVHVAAVIKHEASGHRVLKNMSLVQGATDK